MFAVGLIEAGLRVDKEWTGGFQGAIEIPIRNPVNNGWELEIRFDRPVTVDVCMKNSFLYILRAFIEFILGLVR